MPAQSKANNIHLLMPANELSDLNPLEVSLNSKRNLFVWSCLRLACGGACGDAFSIVTLAALHARVRNSGGPKECRHCRNVFPGRAELTHPQRLQ